MASLNPVHIADQHWRHGFTFVDDARQVRIHYIDCPAANKEKGTVLLIHGYPNTSYQWRHVITPISKGGYRVIAPDYRGAGDSSHPRSGYDKFTVANDLHKVVYDHLSKCDSPRSDISNICRNHNTSTCCGSRYRWHDCTCIRCSAPRTYSIRHVGRMSFARFRAIRIWVQNVSWDVAFHISTAA